MHLVLFDLDNTLLAGDSDYEWGQYLIAQGIVDRADYETRNQAFYQDYQAGRLDIQAFLAFALAPLAAHPRAQLDAWRADYLATRVTAMMTPAARALVKTELARADLVAVITATNRFVTEPIAAAFGIAHLIATDPEEIDGAFTGRVVGIPCFREGKVARLHAFLTAQGTSLDAFTSSRFYSDSQNDLPLLEAVDEAIAVDPDPVLRVHAETRGWPIISLRAG